MLLHICMRLIIIVFSPDGKYFATCSMDKSIKALGRGNVQVEKNN